MPAKTHGVGSFPNRTQSYRAWLSARNRCRNENGPDYPYYGGRGITFCPRWDDYALFLSDMGHPARGQTLDRVDGDGNYTPENCRWASRKTQSRNRSYCKLTPEKAASIRSRYSAGGVSQSQLASEFGVTQPLISQVTRGIAWI